MQHYPKIEDLTKIIETEAYSQSKLKKILNNDMTDYKETASTIIGSYLDSVLTSPNLTDELFVIGIEKRPSDKIREILDEVFETISVLSGQVLGLDNYHERVLTSMNEKSYQPRWGDEAKLKSLERENAYEYWNMLIEANGKTIITKDEQTLVTQLVSMILGTELGQKYFIDQREQDMFYQKGLYWRYGNYNCKGALDILILDHANKKIKIVDLKSTNANTVEGFFYSIKKYNYPLQMAYYSEGAKRVFKDTEYRNYTIECSWLVVNKDINNFKFFEVPVTSNMLLVGRQGVKIHNRTYELAKLHPGFQEYPGWKTAFEVLEKSLGKPDFDLYYNTSNGKLTEENADYLFFT